MLARPLRSLRPMLCVVGAALSVIAGCSSSDVTTTAVTHPTMIEVPPESFLGDVPCSPNGPGLKRYVATLFDINYVAADGSGGTGGSGGATGAAGTGSGGEFRLPSSGPTQCRASVGFGRIIAQRRYRVEVDGYDTDDLRPRALGAREMTDSAGNLVEPKWRAVCTNPATAVDVTVVQFDGCLASDQFQVDAAIPSSVTLDLASLLGSLRCGNGEGEVDHFEVSATIADGEPEIRTVPCTTDARTTFEELAPDVRLSAYVTAFSADGSSAFAGASCSARTAKAANVDATCGALSQTGTLRVDLSGALSLLELTCSESSLSRLEIRVPGSEAPQVVTPPACLQPFDYGFAPGAAALTVTALDGARAELGSVTCHAEVTPGALVSASCEPNRAN